MTTTEPSQPWWTELYDDLLATMLLERTDRAEVDGTVAFLVRTLGLAPGARVLDQCCGIGSLSLPLAAAGHSVVAVDQSAAYVARASLEASARGLTIEATAADACTFTARPAVNAAFNWWTSFGYAATDAENLEMLRRAFDSLVPGGRFALDTLNVPGVLRGFARDVVTRRAIEGGELVLHRESRVDLATGTLHKRWCYFLPDGRRVEHPSTVRLYMPHTLIELLRAAGFGEVELFGSVAGGPLELDSPRCIAVATRPR